MTAHLASVSRRPMTFALSQFSTWVRSADLADRMTAVQYSLDLSRTKRKALVGDVKKQGVGALQDSGAFLSDVVEAKATAVTGDLRAASVNHLFWLSHEDCGECCGLQ